MITSEMLMLSGKRKYWMLKSINNPLRIKEDFNELKFKENYRLAGCFSVPPPKWERPWPKPGLKLYLITKYRFLCWDLSRSSFKRTAHSPGRRPNVKTIVKTQTRRQLTWSTWEYHTVWRTWKIFFSNSLIFKGGQESEYEEGRGRENVICKVIRNIIILYLANWMLNLKFLNFNYQKYSPKLLARRQNLSSAMNISRKGTYESLRYEICIYTKSWDGKKKKGWKVFFEELWFILPVTCFSIFQKFSAQFRKQSSTRRDLL